MHCNYTLTSIVQWSITAAMMLSQELIRNRTNPGNGIIVDHFRGTGTSPWQLCLASNPWFMSTGNLNGPINPWCPTQECLQNDAFLALHSARAGCPLNIWETYWNDLNKPSQTCLMASTLETDLIWTYLMINLIYLFHLLLYIKPVVPCHVQ